MSVYTPEQANGQAPPGPARIPFGPRPTQELLPESASKGLTWLYKNRPQTFADMMLYVHDLDYVTAKKRADKEG